MSFRFGLFITASYFSLAITEDERLAILSFVVFPMVTGLVSLRHDTIDIDGLSNGFQWT